MNKFLSGLLVGAAAGVLLAPRSGKQSRELVKDKATKYSQDTADFVGQKSKELVGKARGMRHEAGETVADVEETVSDIKDEEMEMIEQQEPSSSV